jgi:hypothetical protein
VTSQSSKEIQTQKTFNEWMYALKSQFDVRNFHNVDKNKFVVMKMAFTA